MPTVGKYRRTYFACTRALGIPEADRHWFNEAQVGKESTKDFAPEDWRDIIAWMQRALGDHNDPHAHICEDRPRPVENGAWATEAQAETIEQLCGEIVWRQSPERGPLSLLKRRALVGAQNELRRQLLTNAWAQGARGLQLWRRLTRMEASLVIRILTRMHHFEGQKERAHARD